MKMRCALFALITLAFSPAARPDTLEHEITIEPGQLSQQPNPGGVIVELPSYRASGSPGQPMLPTRTIRLALPAGADLSSLKFHVIDLAETVDFPLNGEKILRAGPIKKLCPPRPGDPTREVIPGSAPDRISPGQTVYRLAGGKLADVPIAEFAHRPVILDQASKVLTLHPRQLLRLTFESLPMPKGDAPAPTRLARTARLVDNPSQLETFYPRPKGPDPEWPGLAVITTDDFVNQSQNLAGFLAAHTERGFEVHVVTESDFGSVQGPAPDGRAQKIRTWLQQNWETLRLGHVVLVGNPHPTIGDVPMLLACPHMPGEEDTIPTDAYYADMTGNWDLDGDERYGEYYGDRGPGGVDFFHELVVGRIPVYDDVEVADRLLARAVTYTRDRRAGDWRKRILLPSAILFFDEYFPHDMEEGAPVHEYVKREFALSGFDTTTLYEVEGEKPSNFDCDLPLNEENLIAEWNTGYGIVFWIGHGDETAVYRMIGDYTWWDSPPFMRSAQYDRLPYETPAFVFHGSCSNGTPEWSNNIGAIQLRSGAIASFASTRVGLSGGTPAGWHPDEENCGLFNIGYYVVTRLRNGMTGAEALCETRALLADAWWADYGWHSKFATTFYGDPTLTLHYCESDEDCRGETCFGQEYCQQGFCEPIGELKNCSHLDEPCKVGRCNEVSKECEAVDLNGGACDDGSWCTLDDTCVAGECLGTGQDCADDDPCTLDTCDPGTDACRHDPSSGADCYDGLYCTVEDVCETGTCAGSARVCPLPKGPCLIDVCDEDADLCRIVQAPDGAICSLDGKEGVCELGSCTIEQASGCGGCSSSSHAPGIGLAFLVLLGYMGLGSGNYRKRRW
jgi:hypothetical protein